MTDPLAMRLRRVVHSLREPSLLPTLRLLWKLDDPRLTLPFQELERIATTLPSPIGQSPNAMLGHPPSEIPPLIFQTWKSKTDIPAHYRYWRATFREKNPSYAMVLWDDHDNRNFIATEYNWFLTLYDSFPKEIFRADAIRPFFLFQHGGIYADMDTECLRPLDSLRARGNILLCRMGGDNSFAHSLPNAIMASKPQEVFWLFMIAMIMEAAQAAAIEPRPLGPEYVTGPVLLGRAYQRFQRSSRTEIAQAIGPILELLTPAQRSHISWSTPEVLAREEWYPLDWTNMVHKGLCRRLRDRKLTLRTVASERQFPQSTFVTYWSHSW